MPSDPEPHKDLDNTTRDYVASTLITNYVLYATACVLVYELVTTLDEEVARVWSLKWRLPKILFMLNRYVIRAMLLALWVLADLPGTTQGFCTIYAYWQMFPLRLAILAAQALVTIRVWAIYNNSRRMGYVFGSLYGIEFIAVLICVVVATLDTEGHAQPAPLSCALNSKSGHILKEYASATWIAPVVFEFVMLLFTLVKIAPRWKWAGKGFMGTGGNPTLDILARDSLVYFGLIFSFTLANAITYELSFTGHYKAILLGPTSAVSCIAVSRMMINIRSLPSSPVGMPTSTRGMYERPDLSFAAYNSAAYDVSDIVVPRDGEYGAVPPSARTSGEGTHGDNQSTTSYSYFEMGLRQPASPLGRLP